MRKNQEPALRADLMVEAKGNKHAVKRRAWSLARPSTADHNGSNMEIIMAEISVTPGSTHNSNSSGYQLHPAHRVAILAGSDSAKRTLKIEQQRLRFIEKNGNDGTHFNNQEI